MLSPCWTWLLASQPASQHDGQIRFRASLSTDPIIQPSAEVTGQPAKTKKNHVHGTRLTKRITNAHAMWRNVLISCKALLVRCIFPCVKKIPWYYYIVSFHSRNPVPSMQRNYYLGTKDTYLPIPYHGTICGYNLKF